MRLWFGVGPRTPLPELCAKSVSGEDVVDEEVLGVEERPAAQPPGRPAAAGCVHGGAAAVAVAVRSDAL